MTSLEAFLCGMGAGVALLRAVQTALNVRWQRAGDRMSFLAGRQAALKENGEALSALIAESEVREEKLAQLERELAALARVRPVALGASRCQELRRSGDADDVMLRCGLDIGHDGEHWWLRR